MALPSKWIDAKHHDPVTKVAVRSLKGRLAVVLHYLPLAAMRYEDDIEYVHHLRVWTRRTDAAIDMYRELLPEWRAVWISKQMDRIRKATNDARDDDVFASRLENAQSPAALGLLEQVREHRSEAQQHVREVHERLNNKGGRLARRVDSLLKRVRLRGDHKKSKEPDYRAWVTRQLRPILVSFFEMAEADLEDTRRLHQFRIAGKKLRYAMELSTAAFGAEFREEAYPLLETLQDRLGELNDHASALVRVDRWRNEARDADRVEYLDEILQCEQDLLAMSRQDFSAWWSVDQSRRLQAAFKRAMRV